MRVFVWQELKIVVNIVVPPELIFWFSSSISVQKRLPTYMVNELNTGRDLYRRIFQYCRKNIRNVNIFSLNFYKSHIAECANIAEFVWVFCGFYHKEFWVRYEWRHIIRLTSQIYFLKFLMVAFGAVLERWWFLHLMLLLYHKKHQLNYLCFKSTLKPK